MDWRKVCALLSFARVDIQEIQIAIKLARKSRRATNRRSENAVLYLPWKKTHMKRRREIIGPASSGQDMRPIRSETRVALVTSIASGRRWLDEIVTGCRFQKLDTCVPVMQSAQDC